MMKMSIRGGTGKASGFALPALVITSLVLMVVSLSVVQVGTSITRAVRDQAWSNLAKEAAQAGVSYVAACMESGTFEWTGGKLTPTTNCDGVEITSNTPSLYITKNITNNPGPRYQSTFSVNKPKKESDGIARALVTGKTELLGADEATVTKTYIASYTAILSMEANKAAQISTAVSNTCVVTVIKKIYCAGSNYYGQFGDGSSVSSTTPTQFGGSLDKMFEKVSVGSGLSSNTICALTADQLVYCAGRNNRGQFGNGSTTDSATPVRFGGASLESKRFTQVVVGGANVICALATDQLVYCAGYNERGQIGVGSTGAIYTNPVQFGPSLGGLRFTQIAVNEEGEDICVLATNQQIYCAGYNRFGQFGVNTTVSYNIPVIFGNTTSRKYTQASIHQSTSCSLATDQIIYCAGLSAYGGFANGSASHTSLTPIAFGGPGGGGRKFTKVAQHLTGTCAIATDQQAYCTGRNALGSFGNGTTTPSYTLVPYGGATFNKKFTQVVTGYDSICAITTDGIAYCSGWNSSGSFGNGTTTMSITIPTPFKLPGM